MIQQSRSAGYILTVTVEGVNDRYTWATQNVIKFICPVKILKNILPMRIANINISFFYSEHFLPLLVLYSNDVEQNESLKKPLEDLVRRKRSQIPTQ